MKQMRGFFIRLAGLFKKARRDRELADELDGHLRMHIADNLRLGMTPEEARRIALIKLGGMDSAKERYRDQRGVPVLEALIQDLRYTARLLRKSPGFTAVAVLTLALGVGANTAIFSVVDAALLRPVPFRNSSRVVVIWINNLSRGFNRVGPTGQDYLDWREQNKSFEDTYLFEHGSGTVIGQGEPEQVAGLRVTTNFADFLGFRPILGRAFLPEEERGVHNVAMLSYEYWQRKFGADPAVVGRQFMLNSELYTIIGVVPPKVWTGWPSDVVVPWNVDRLRQADSDLGVFGRLKPGVTLKLAQSDMAAVAERISQIRPEQRKAWGVTVLPLKDVTVEYIRPALLILLLAVGLVLLIACANVANLLLARALGRQKEIAVRVALGAGRLRLIRQFLTEGIVLGLVGGLAGLLLALWGSTLLYMIIPASIPVPDAAAQVGLPRGHIDSSVLCFALALSIVVGALFGLAPAVGCIRGNPGDSLKDGARGGGGSSRAARPRSALVVCETAFAVILVIGSGLMIKSFWHLLSVSPGFNPDHVVAVRIKLPTDAADSPYREPAKRILGFKRFLDQVQAAEGVQSAALTEIVPLSQEDMDFSAFVIDEQPAQSAAGHIAANFRIVSPGYFGTMQIPLRGGRAFSDVDDLEHQRVVVVDETAARRFFGGRNPVGEHIRLPDSSGRPREIIGIVGSVLDDGLDKQAKPTIYVSSLQASPQTMSLIVRTTMDPSAIVSEIKKAIWTVDSNQPVFDVRIVNDIVSNTVSAERVAFVLLTVFASIALLLAAVGIYGVTSYSVSQRVHEVGVRMALGANRSDVMKLVVWQGMQIAGGGIILGAIGALGLSRLMSSLLYGVAPSDPATFVGAVLCLSLVALLANYVPARRAANVSPMMALRCE